MTGDNLEREGGRELGGEDGQPDMFAPSHTWIPTYASVTYSISDNNVGSNLIHQRFRPVTAHSHGPSYYRLNAQYIGRARLRV